MYPEIQPYKAEHLPVSDGHNLYLEQSGNSQGQAVLFLHGGPGGGCQPWNRQFFDPTGYRIILFDQRGAGRSTPHASLEENTTQHLIADIEAIRVHLKIERWVVFGGSWGSTLALAYAEQNPERVLGLILRGVFLCRDVDIHWFYQYGAGRLFPGYWEDFLAPIPELERYDLVTAYYKRLSGDDEVARMACAEAWSLWEGRTATLKPNTRLAAHFSEPHFATAMARIECHYFINQAFMHSNQLLEDAYRLAEIPGVIVHGRYDVICPVDQACLLHQEWPKSELKIIPDAGHAASEPGITKALLQATDGMLAELT